MILFKNGVPVSAPRYHGVLSTGKKKRHHVRKVHLPSPNARYANAPGPKSETFYQVLKIEDPYIYGPRATPQGTVPRGWGMAGLGADLGAPADVQVDRLGGLVVFGARVLKARSAFGYEDAVEEAKRYLSLVKDYQSSGSGVVAAEARRGYAALSTAIGRVEEVFSFNAASTMIGQGWREMWGGPGREEVSRIADRDIAIAETTGSHIQGLARDIRAGGVSAGNLVRPGAIAAGQEADRRTGASDLAAQATADQERKNRENRCNLLALASGEQSVMDCVPPWVKYAAVAAGGLLLWNLLGGGFKINL